MASVFGFTDPPSNVEYSINTGEPREVVIRGITLLDKSAGIDEPRWADALCSFVREFGLDKDKPHGRHAFVYWLAENGYLTD